MNKNLAKSHAITGFQLVDHGCNINITVVRSTGALQFNTQPFRTVLRNKQIRKVRRDRITYALHSLYFRDLYPNLIRSTLRLRMIG